MFETFLSTLGTTAQVWLSWAIKILFIVFVLAIARLLTKFLSKIMRKHMKGHIEPTVLELTEIAIKSVIYIIAIIIALGGLGIKGILMPMLTSAGILGIILGFALKDTLSNIFAGISLFLDEPFKIGDMVKIGELTGRLYDIGLRSTQIKTFDNNLIILPNNFVAESHITNYSKSDPKIRVEADVSISYESNIDKAMKILMGIAKEDKNVLEDPTPEVRVLDLGDSGITLQLKFWVPTAFWRNRGPSNVRLRIKKDFDKEGIEIPYPRMYMIDGGKAKKGKRKANPRVKKRSRKKR